MVAGLAGLAPADEGSGTQVVPLSYQVHYDWDLTMPAEQFSVVGGAFPIPHAGGDGFRAELKGTALAIDTNGDGKADVTARGARSVVKFHAPAKGGGVVTYAARLVNRNGWRFAASGSMAGEFRGVPIRLVDQNNNGRYDDVGADAMIVGSSNSACFLSSVIHVDGKLYRAKAAADGTSLQLTPYTGPAGTLDLRSDFRSAGKLLSAVVRSSDGQYSFELSRARTGLTVPAGEYRLAFGLVGKGRERAYVRTGRSGPIEVKDKGAARFAWGGPLKAKFDCRRAGEQLSFSPRQLWFYGRAGEEYHNFAPEGRSPEFQVVDVNTSRDLMTAKFGVSQ